MSADAVCAFYRELESDPVLRKEALELKKHFPDQGELIHAFIVLGERRGFRFTPEELMEYIFSRGTPES